MRKKILKKITKYFYLDSSMQKKEFKEQPKEKTRFTKNQSPLYFAITLDKREIKKWFTNY